MMDSQENNVSDEERVDDDTQQRHIMLSYQWDDQKLVEDIYNYLKEEQKIPVWMDKHGGMQDNVMQRLKNSISYFSFFINFRL